MSSNSAAQLRPRNRRLVSVEGDDGGSAGATGSSTPPRNHSPTAAHSSSLRNSRAPSPLPLAHPSRANSTGRGTPKAKTSPRAWTFTPTSTPGVGPLSANRKSNYWETSWTSIQGIASTLLGSDIKDPQSNHKSHSIPRRRRSKGGGSGGGHGSKYSISTPDAWGPEAPPNAPIDITSLAAGTQEERLALLQAKKREALLLAEVNGYKDGMLDSRGRFKRRTSVEETSSIPFDVDEDVELRAYLHKVQPGDTLAGLSIKYGCAQEVLRKANRLWPNDSIQLRNLAFVPVDASSTRGRRVEVNEGKQSAVDLLSVNIEADDTLTTPTRTDNPDWTIAPADTKLNTAAASSSIPSTQQSSPNPASSASNPTAEQLWTPDSWVEIDHIPHPVQVVRLPRRALGFFPPARRKSLSSSTPNIAAPYTDATPPGSRGASPAPSNPLTRHRNRGSKHYKDPATDDADADGAAAAANAAAASDGPTSSPLRRGRSLTSRFPRPAPNAAVAYASPGTLQPPAGPASLKPPHAASAGAANHFLAALRSGPGGVGSLGKTSRSPGPAKDGLNRFFEQHFPGVGMTGPAAGPTTGVIGLGREIGGGRVGSSGGGGSLPRRSSFESVGSTGSISELGGRVEGWVRKIARKDGGSRARGNSSVEGSAKGDLIELVDSWDSGAVGAEAVGSAGAGGATNSSAREERALRERFPPKGKVFEEQSRR